jgi:hypothetical protein
MDKNEIVTINGQRYNAHTGMPLEVTKASSVMTPKPTPAAGIHAAPQKSQTLIRRATKKPPVSINSRLLSKPGRSMDIARSNKIARFAPHPVKPPVKATSVPDIAATTHPVVKNKRPLRLKRQNRPKTSSMKQSSLHLPNQPSKHRKNHFSSETHASLISLVLVRSLLLLAFILRTLICLTYQSRLPRNRRGLMQLIQSTDQMATDSMVP